MRKNLALGVLVLLALALVGCDEQPTTLDGPTRLAPENDVEANRGNAAHQREPDGTHQRELAEVRRGTARYHNLRTAEAAGYVPFSIHVPNMGIHYVQGSAFGEDGTSELDRSLDRSDPENLVYVDRATRSPQQRLVAVEYSIPKGEEEENPPPQAVSLFTRAGADDWHVHPSTHELPLDDDWTVHAECHYESGAGVFLAEDPAGDFVLWPPGPYAGTWSGTIEPEQCPDTLGGSPLLGVHGKWWTLHVWVWLENPDGVFHETNPRVD